MYVYLYIHKKSNTNTNIYIYIHIYNTFIRNAYVICITVMSRRFPPMRGPELFSAAVGVEGLHEAREKCRCSRRGFSPKVGMKLNKLGSYQ